MISLLRRQSLFLWGNSMLRNPGAEKTQLFEIANLFEKNKSTKGQFRHLTVDIQNKKKAI
jgi:hypothetical protein